MGIIPWPLTTTEARESIRRSVEHWNALNAEALGVIVLPLLWETSSTPGLGDRPQAIINRQLVDGSDILVGTFWTRLGTPTGEAVSGSVEEINRFVESGKPVLLYFSSVPVAPDNLDAAQLAALRSFRGDMERQGVISTYSSLAELERRVAADLTRTIRGLLGGDFIGVGPALANSMAPSSEGDALNTYKAKLRGVTAQYQMQWATLKDGRHVEEARRLASLLAQEIAEFLGAVASISEVGTTLYTRLQMLGQRASRASRAPMHLDGGVSLAEFVQDVDTVLDGLVTLTAHDWMALTK